MLKNPLASYLADNNLRQKDVADMIDVAQAVISDWANDRRHPSVSNAFRLEKATNGAIPASSWANRQLDRSREIKAS